MLSSGKGKSPGLEDFVMRWGKGRRQTAEEQLAIFRALASQFDQKG